MSKNTARENRLLEVLSKIFLANKKDISTWLFLYAPFLIGTQIFLVCIIIIAFWGEGDKTFAFNLIAFFTFLLASASGVLQIIKRESPGSNFRIIRGKKAIVIGIIWFIILFSLSLFFLFQALLL